MPRAKARQTTINDHFSPRATRSNAGRPARASQARPFSQVHRFHSDSEGEEGIANIPLDPLPEAGPSQVRVIGRTILDSEDEDEPEEQYVSPAKRRRKKETLKRPHPNPDGKALMSIPVSRKSAGRKGNHGDGDQSGEEEDEDEDKDEEDEDTVERKLTRRQSSSSAGEVIDVAETEGDEPSENDILILDAPLGSFAERRSSGLMDDLASGSSQRSQRASSKRARETPVIEVTAPSGRPLRQRAERAPVFRTVTKEDDLPKVDSAPTRSDSRSTRSQSRLQAVVELRSWSQEERRPYSLHNSPDSEVPSGGPVFDRVSRAAPASAKTSQFVAGDDGEPVQVAVTKNPTRRHPPTQTSAKHNNVQSQTASSDTDSPILLDDDDLPLSLPTPGRTRPQRTSSRPATAQIVELSSDSSEPVQKRTRRLPTQRRGVDRQRADSSTPPAKRKQVPIMPMMSDSEEEDSLQPVRKTGTGSRRGLAGPSSASQHHQRGRIRSDQSARGGDPNDGNGRVASRAERGGAAKERTTSRTGSRSNAESTGKARYDAEGLPSSDADASDDNDLQMDEMKRFKTESRLRKQKETPFQRNLRKMKAKQRGIVETTTEEDDEAEEDDEDVESSAHSLDDSDGFYVTDEGDDEAARRQIPAQFRIESAQTPEYKFKVVLHYFVYLVVNGPKALPLRGKNADYFGPMLRDVRRLLEGYRNSRVRSQIWRSEFVQVLEKYPEYSVTRLAVGHTGCDACHISGRYSLFQVRLEGDPYDPETHEPYEIDSEEERKKEREKKAKTKRRARRIRAGSDPSSSEEDEEPRLFHMGKYCNARAETYHAMSHWEDVLYYRIRAKVKLLRRALGKTVPSDSEASSSEIDSDEPYAEREERRSERRVRRETTWQNIAEMRRRGSIPRYDDVDAITQWMDDRGDQARVGAVRAIQADQQELVWFNNLITKSENLERDKNKTDE